MKKLWSVLLCCVFVTNLIAPAFAVSTNGTAQESFSVLTEDGEMTSTVSEDRICVITRKNQSIQVVTKFFSEPEAAYVHNLSCAFVNMTNAEIETYAENHMSSANKLNTVELFKIETVSPNTRSNASGYFIQQMIYRYGAQYYELLKKTNTYQGVKCTLKETKTYHVSFNNLITFREVVEISVAVAEVIYLIASFGAGAPAAPIIKSLIYSALGEFGLSLIPAGTVIDTYIIAKNVTRNAYANDIMQLSETEVTYHAGLYKTTGAMESTPFATLYSNETRFNDIDGMLLEAWYQYR